MDDKAISIWLPVWGQFYVNLLKFVLPSLRQPGNFYDAGWKHAYIDILTTPEWQAEIEATVRDVLGSKVPLTIQTHLRRHGVNPIVAQIGRVRKRGTRMLIVTADTAFAAGSISNLAEYARGKPITIAAPHLRVNEDSFRKAMGGAWDNHVLSSPEMVELAMRHAHQSAGDAEESKDNNILAGGLALKRMSHHLWLIVHHLPTPFLIWLEEEDEKFFNISPVHESWDHEWPSVLVKSHRYRVCASSDFFFAAELTSTRTNLAPIAHGSARKDLFRHDDRKHCEVNACVVGTLNTYNEKRGWRMQERLHILMPSVRAHNIKKIADSYLLCEGHSWELRWHILQQGAEPDPKGFRKINEALEWFLDGWFFAPSDDTVHHPALLRRAGEIAAQNPSCGCIVFSQNRGKEVLRASPESMRPCHVDGSQTIWKRSFVGAERFDFDKYGGTADGHFAAKLYGQRPEAFVFIDEVLTNFNSLEW